MLYWYVFKYDINAGKIVRYNIFSHGGFMKEVNELRDKEIDKETFEKEVNSSLMYYFWAKSEYEVVISSWPNQDVDIKVDIYEQVKSNWNVFINYLWNELFEGGER